MTKASRDTFTVAAVQAAPVFLDREATVEKACKLLAETGRQGARLAVFPEAFIPTYPDWVWAIPSYEIGLHNSLYAELLANSVAIPSEATDQLCRAARRAKAYVVIGLNERNVEASGASLYNTLLYINAQGDIMGKHRKLVPTAAERLVWAQGDGSTLEAYDTPLGKLGGLICWENYMPLARYTMYAWGTQIYVAATWDRGQAWLATLQHIAREGRVYVIGCSIALRKDDIPDRYEFKQRFYASAGEWINVGDSAIVHPNGQFLAGPARAKEEVLYAEVDPSELGGAKWLFDVAGHYARPDVFQLTVNQQPRPMLRTELGGPEAAPPAPPPKRRSRRR
ncbi:MAG: nitrilase [Chloroflexi bacterium RBG_16_68_14]|nr:MAG: nitrilase [Chloroflexi bacterium RBG_16_68_14]